MYKKLLMRIELTIFRLQGECLNPLGHKSNDLYIILIKYLLQVFFKLFSTIYIISLEVNLLQRIECILRQFLRKLHIKYDNKVACMSVSIKPHTRYYLLVTIWNNIACVIVDCVCATCNVF